jgi:predicted Zn-dependent peptidase
VERAFHAVPARGSAITDVAPATVADVLVRSKDLEQSHVCFGTPALSYGDADRYAAFALNTMLGGSMSSRLFQNVRERRGLAYSVFSSLSAYRDAGALTVYAGCANESVQELVDVVVQELRRMRDEPLAAGELRRAKDHLKGSLMLGLESTSSRMSHLARQAIYDDAEESLDAMLDAIERVTEQDVARLGQRVLAPGTLGLTVLGGVNGLTFAAEQLTLA